MLKKIFIIDGAAGTGKTDFIQYVRNRFFDANVVCKYTTRAIRDEDDKKNLDLIFLSEDEFENRKFKKENMYEYGESLYGFLEKDIDESLEKFEYTIIIIRNYQIINYLVNKYKERAFVIPVFIYTDRNLVEQRLRLDGYTQEKIEYRLERSESCWQDYLENDYLEIPIIINNSSKVDFHRKIKQLFESRLVNEKHNYLYINPYLKYELISPLYGYKRIMQSKLEKYPFEKNIFLMMKFRNENMNTYKYIKKELKQRGFNCVRADDKDWTHITDTSFNPMAVLYCCKYGIALFDEAEKDSAYNPNVAYELGMMQCQNKKCLILKHFLLPNPPFDIVKDLYKTYSKEIEFEEILDEWLMSLKDES